MTHLVMTHLVMILPGCFYDWDVGSPSSSQSSSSSSGSGGVDAGPDCTELSLALETARANAKACTFGMAGQCTASVTDERGCTSWLNDASSVQAQAFTQAVDDFGAAACTPSSMPCGMSVPSCLFVTTKYQCVP
ncbi:MAG TPA: hypothetical protein PK156_00230 [Polyangium sp.]|nr:hypothetical protein [Polyangium sp.]